ncbi:MAG: ATP-binding cassette domain-containing protein [Gemmatimonadales bacterium]
MTAPVPLELDGIPMTGSMAGIFNLEVHPHETVAILGDEVSGVDTLGALALALAPLATGQARIFGVNLHELARREQLAFRRRVGYLPAGDGLLSNLSLRDNIVLCLRFGSEIRGSEISGRVDVILAQMRLTRVGHLRPAMANEEERRRAALGRAIALDPALMILEQPFVGLTDRVAAELLELARGGETAEGGRRSVLITGQDIPALLRHRVDRVVQVADSRRHSVRT